MSSPFLLLQAAGTAPGTTVTSAGKTRRPSASSAPTPSARPTRRGRCARGPPQVSCAARSTTSWTAPTTRIPVSTLSRMPRAPPLPPSPAVLLKAPGRRKALRPKPRAPRGKQRRPDLRPLPEPEEPTRPHVLSYDPGSRGTERLHQGTLLLLLLLLARPRTFLVPNIFGFISARLRRGRPSVVTATQPHKSSAQVRWIPTPPSCQTAFLSFSSSS